MQKVQCANYDTQRLGADKYLAQQPTASSDIWLEEQLQALNLVGRDDMHTYLLRQEIPFWFGYVLDNRESDISRDYAVLVERRGFDVAETAVFRRLATFFVVNAADIRRRFSWSPCTQQWLACVELEP